MRNLKLLLLFLITIFSSNISCSQKLDKADLKSRNIAHSVVYKHFKEEVKNKNYIIFSVSDEKFIVTIENKNSYDELYYDSTKNNSVIDKVTYDIKNELMNKIFDKSNYKKDFISFNSDYFKPEYDASSGNITYFVYNTLDGKKYGEARLSMIVKPNPIPADIYMHYVKRILCYANNN